MEHHREIGPAAERRCPLAEERRREMALEGRREGGPAAERRSPLADKGRREMALELQREGGPVAERRRLLAEERRCEMALERRREGGPMAERKCLPAEERCRETALQERCSEGGLAGEGRSPLTKKRCHETGAVVTADPWPTGGACSHSSGPWSVATARVARATTRCLPAAKARRARAGRPSGRAWTVARSGAGARVLGLVWPLARWAEWLVARGRRTVGKRRGRC